MTLTYAYTTGTYTYYIDPSTFVATQLGSDPGSTSLAFLTPDSTTLVVKQAESYVQFADTTTNAFVGSGLNLQYVSLNNNYSRLVGNNTTAYAGGRSFGGTTAAVAAVDIATQTLITTISLPNPGTSSASSISDLIVSPDGSYVYACQSLTTLGEYAVTKIDTTTNTIVGSATAPGNSYVTNLTITPDGTTVYAFDGALSQIYAVDAASMAIIATITLPTSSNYPTGSAAYASLYPSRTGSFVFVGVLQNLFGGSTAIANTPSIYTIDVASNTLIYSYVGLQPADPSTYAWEYTVAQPNPNPTNAYILAAFLEATKSQVLYTMSQSTGELTATTTLTGHEGIQVDNATPAVSTDGNVLYIPNWKNTGATPGTTDVWTLSPLSNVANVETPAVSFVVTANIPYVPPPPVTPVVTTTVTYPTLFIPRKGLKEYNSEDLGADWRAIERWANSWSSVPLVLPFKNDNVYPEREHVNANWITLETWANQVGVASLLVPRKTSTEPDDLTIDFLAVQRWANTLAGA